MSLQACLMSALCVLQILLKPLKTNHLCDFQHLFAFNEQYRMESYKKNLRA